LANGEGEFQAEKVADGLSLRPDPDKPEEHGFVEPDAQMSLDAYRQALAATRDQWERAED
jgi:hypothetical protein